LQENEALMLQKNVDSEWELLQDRIEMGKRHG